MLLYLALWTVSKHLNTRLATAARRQLIQLGVFRGAASERVTVGSPGRKEWRMSMGSGKMMVVLFSPDIELTANTVTFHT